MYLRRHDKKVAGEDYEYWSLVESVRTARGPRQRIVATIGKLPGLDREERIGWDEIGRILSGKPRPEPRLFEKMEEPPSWATVSINGVSVERLRHFGDAYLGLLLWNRLDLASFCKEQIPPGREDIPWSVMASILVLARFCAPSSELQIAESWYDKTALDDLFGVPCDKINDDRLYRALDSLLPHKDDLCRHLQKRYGELFGSTFDFLFYDITSTYFEGSAKGNPQAKRGYSRDSRPDCPQVCIGMVSENNLKYLRSTGARYLVGTPKSMLKKFERELLEQSWEEVQPGVDVKVCRSPEGTEETFVLCRSLGRREKENAILNRFVTRLEAGLAKLVGQAEKGKLKDRQKVERRIGRLLEQNSRAAALFTVDVTERSDKKLSIIMRKNEERYLRSLDSGGSYILRTNWMESDPKTLWNTYIQLTEVEDSFRTEKHDLGMRPIFHRKKDRAQAHILICFLALAMWRSLQ
jgi:transposase